MARPCYNWSMTNHTDSAQIVTFPAQFQELETPLDSLSDAEVVQEARMRAASILNKYATGKIDEIPEEVKEAIRKVNSFCLEFGFPLIDCEL